MYAAPFWFCHIVSGLQQGRKIFKITETLRI
jgi:hypothetical protein